jgi:hypothetical protein
MIDDNQRRNLHIMAQLVNIGNLVKIQRSELFTSVFCHKKRKNNY